MHRSRSASRFSWIAAVVFFNVLGLDVMVTAQSLPGTGVLVRDAPVFVVPDASRTPLTTLRSGTSVRVREERGEWYEIDFRDVNYGDRRGFIAKAVVLLQPVDAAPPSAQPVPPYGAAVPPVGQRTASPSARPRVERPSQETIASVNVGRSLTARVFHTTTTSTTFAEPQTIDVTYADAHPLLFDVSAIVGAAHGLGAAIGVSVSSKPVQGAVSAHVPHPLLFDRDRTVTGPAPDLTQKEVAVHLDGSWMLRLGRSTRVAVFGGPTFFKVTQGLVSDIVVNEAYPYDTATLASATVVENQQSKWGYNGGFDFTQLFTDWLGVGVVGRYSRASLTFDIATGQTVAVKVGGMQVGAGVRLRF